jgi:hypothetical protein
VALHAEILVLRYQLNVLRRKSPKRMAVRDLDRLVSVGPYRLASKVLDALNILQPETVIRWYHAGFRAYWRWKSRRHCGRPKISADIRGLIFDMSVALHWLGSGRANSPTRRASETAFWSTVLISGTDTGSI